MTPQQLQNRVLEELLFDDDLDARRIRVVVQGRDVWLEGEVPTPAMYDLAGRIASQIGGVGDFTNNLICVDEPYDIASHRDGMDLRTDSSTDLTPDGRLLSRLGPFGEESDEAVLPEGDEMGGPVGGDAGAPLHPMEANEIAPFAAEIAHAETPWRYQDDGSNASLEVEPVLPPEDDEV